MTQFFVLLVVTIAIIVYFNRKKQKPLSASSDTSGNNSLPSPQHYRFLFTQNNPSVTKQDLHVGDEVSLWHKPDSDSIQVYMRGTIAGEGYIGRFKSSYLMSNYFSKNIRVKAVVERIENDMVFLSPNLRVINLDEQQEGYFQRDLQQLQKLYSPKSNLLVIFSLKEGIGWNRAVRLKHNKFEDALAEYIEHKDWTALTKHFWLEDLNGQIISEMNQTKKDDTIKFFRAIHTGIQFDIKYRKSENGAGGSYCWELIPQLIKAEK